MAWPSAPYTVFHEPWVVVSVLTNDARAAGGGTTVNVTALLAPPGVVTLMLAGASGAVAATTRVAVIWVPAATTPVAVIPVPRFRVAPVRFVPVRITGWLIPITPDAGAMLVSAGSGSSALSKNNPLTTAFTAPVRVTRRVTCPARLKTRYWPAEKALIEPVASPRPVAGSNTSILSVRVLGYSQSRQYSAS